MYAGSIPIDIDKYEVRSLSSFDGLNVFVGTSDGRIFALDTRQQYALEMNVTTRNDDQTAVTRIVTYTSNEDSFAIYGSSLLQLTGLGWEKVAGLPDETLFSVAVNERFGDPAVFVATDSRVYVSTNGGKTWRIGSEALPERCHGGDLAIGPSFSPDPVLYLATYGRSVWFTALRSA